MHIEEEKKGPRRQRMLVELAHRPAQSPATMQFQKISVFGNIYPVRLEPEKTFEFQYAQKLSPEIPLDSRGMIRNIIKLGEKEIKGKIGSFFYSGQVIFACACIPDAIFITIPQQKTEYTMKIIFVKPLDLKKLSKEKESIQQLQKFNIACKKYMMQMGMKEIGLDIIKGFCTSVDVFQGEKLMIVISSKTKILNQKTALQQIMFLQEEKGYNNARIAEQFIGTSVIAQYGNQRAWRIDGIDFNLTPKDTFLAETGPITQIDQYLQKYGIKIKMGYQPLFINIDKKTQKKTMLVPELCLMSGIPEEIASTKQKMVELANFTKLNPEERKNMVDEHAKKLGKAAENEEFKLIIGNPPEITSFQLPTPLVELGKSKQLKPNSGKFKIEQQVYDCAQIKFWAIVYPQKCEQDTDMVKNLYKNLKEAAKRFNISLGVPLYQDFGGISPANQKNAIDKAMKKEKNLQLICCILVKKIKNDPAYQAIKNIVLREIGIASQCVCYQTLKNPKKLLAICSKILLQMNVKLGYPLWKVEKPMSIADESTMLIGMDVFHNLSQQKNSILGIVSTTDNDFTEFYSRAQAVPKKGQEIIMQFTHFIQLFVKEAIRKYYGRNKQFPQNIIVFRDGVSEGQITYVQREEIPQIYKAFDEISEESKSQFKPKLAILILRKRIEERIFYPNNGNIENPPSGTVVFETLVREGFEFFINSQDVQQGTLTPTKCSVIHNTTNWHEDAFWVLTQQQCYNYFNWPGAVRVPGVTQQAHKLAYLVGESMEDEANPGQHGTLYYL